MIGALIITWNRRDDALECVESVLRSDVSGIRIYVVDNASTDGTGDAISRAYDEVRVIRSETNLGFAEGANLGLGRALGDGCDFVFLLNDDVVVEPDALGLLRESLDDPRVGVAAPKVLCHSEPSRIWSAGATVDPRTGIATQRFHGEFDRGQADVSCEVDYAVGCAMLVGADVVRDAGMMRPEYHLYYEEADWCRRIRQAGYRIRYVPESIVRHKVTFRQNGRNHAAYYFARNRLLYLRHGGASPGGIARIALADILRSAVGHAAGGRLHESLLMFRAVRDYYAGNLGRYGNHT